MLEDLKELPNPILEHILTTTLEEYEYRNETLHVTELLYCLRKAYLRRTHLDIEKELEQRWYLYRGSVFDRLWCELFPRNQIRITYRIPNGPTIVGKIDFINKEGDDLVLYELKTIANRYAIKDGPKEGHIKQAKFYAWCENIDVAKLVYVSFEGVKIFTVDCSDAHEVVKELEERAKLLYNCLKKERLPPRTDKEWECRYCEFRDICSVEEIRQEVKDLVVME